MFRVRAFICATDDGIWHMDVERLFAPGAARTEHIQTHSGDDGRQPAREVFDPRGVGAAETQPGLLDGVVSLSQRSEHSVGDSAQPRPVLFELISEPILFHGPGALFVARRSTDLSYRQAGTVNSATITRPARIDNDTSQGRAPSTLVPLSAIMRRFGGRSAQDVIVRTPKMNAAIHLSGPSPANRCEATAPAYL